MKRYEITFRIHPAYLFGIPSDGHDVAPASDAPQLIFDPITFEQSMSRIDGTPTIRRYDERVQATLRLNGLGLTFDDNYCTVALDSLSADAAIEYATEELNRLLQLLAMSMPGPSSRIIPEVVAVRENGRPLRKNVSDWYDFVAYDNGRTSAELLALALSLDGLPHDKLLERALKYLTLGDALLGAAPGYAPDGQQEEIAPLRFLQYWKALTTILGDPSRDKDHQSRPQKIGLDRSFFRQRVNPMKVIRDKFDVAHVFDSREGRTATHSEAKECRGVAVMAIEAYLKQLRERFPSDGHA